MRTIGEWRGRGPWKTWFAWYPLMINGQSVWLRTVKRRHQYREKGSLVERRWTYQLPPGAARREKTAR